MSVNYYKRLTILTSILIGLAAFVSDQIIKSYVVDYFTSLHSKALLYIINHLNINLVWNKGISFGMLSGQLSHLLLPILTIIILIILCSYFLRKGANITLIYPALALIIGGAISNVADRIYYGAVVDYIDIYYKHYHFPTFNLADTYIFIGAICLILFDCYNGGTRAKSG